MPNSSPLSAEQREAQGRLEQASLRELKVIAKRLGVVGFSSVRKSNRSDLILRIVRKDAARALALIHPNAGESKGDGAEEDAPRLDVNQSAESRKAKKWFGLGRGEMIGIIATIVCTAIGVLAQDILFSAADEIEDRPQSEPIKRVITVGSKNFMESCILAEIMALTIKAELGPDIIVERDYNQPKTKFVKSELFAPSEEGYYCYPEYSGTIYSLYVNDDEDPDEFDRVRLKGWSAHTEAEIQRALDSRFAGWEPPLRPRWLGSFGIHNGYALVMNREGLYDWLDKNGQGVADKSHPMISEIVELGKKRVELESGESVLQLKLWKIAAFGEAINRQDCLRGLTRYYGDLRFDEHKLQPDDQRILYDALLPTRDRRVGRNLPDHQMEMIVGFTTDSMYKDKRFIPLVDDKCFFQPYVVGPIVLQSTLDAFPGLEAALSKLEGCFGDGLKDLADTSVTLEDRSDQNGEFEKLMNAIEDARVNESSSKRLMITPMKLGVDRGDYPAENQRFTEIIQAWLVETGLISDL